MNDEIQERKTVYNNLNCMRLFSPKLLIVYQKNATRNQVDTLIVSKDTGFDFSILTIPIDVRIYLNHRIEDDGE